MSLLLLLLFNIDALVNVYLNCLSHTRPSSFSSPAVLWSFSLPAARTTNFSTVSHPRRHVPAASFPPLPPCPSPRRPHLTAAASFRSTSQSSQGAKLWTWLHSVALPMAMQACTPPCHPSVRPPSISTSSMCPALWPAKSLTTERPKLKARPRSLSSISKVRIKGIILRFNEIQVHCGGKFCCSALSQ